MQKYNSCFIGIPLPEEFMDRFHGVIASLKMQDIGLKTVNPNTPPHITVFYLGDQPKKALEEVWSKTEPYVSMLSNVELTVSGMGTFGERLPRVLFSKVIYPPEFEKFTNIIHGKLSVYQQNEHDTFRPHLTLARLYNHHAKKEFLVREAVIEQLLDRILWRFTVTKLVLYGINPDDGERHHRPLFEIDF